MVRKNRNTPSIKWFVALAFVALAAIRLALVWPVLLNPAQGITFDSKGYLSLAENLMQNGAYQSQLSPTMDLFRPPGYPLFLALIFTLTGKSMTGVLLTQWCLGLICAYLIYRLGSQYGSQQVGFAGAFLFMLSPNALYWSTTFMTEILFTLGIAAAFLWIGKAAESRFPGWGVGLLLGLMTLVRPIGLYLIPVWAIWLFLRLMRQVHWQAAFKEAVFLLIAALVVIMPWAVRNHRTHDKFVISTVGDVTLRSFHLALTLVEADGIPWDEAKVIVRQGDQNLRSDLAIILDHPIAFARAQIRGIARSGLGTEVGTWLRIAYDRSYEGSGILDALIRGDPQAIQEAFRKIGSKGDLLALGLMVWGLVYALLVFLLGVLGFSRVWKIAKSELRGLLILAVITIAYLILITGASGEARFRIPAEPLLAFLGGWVFLEGTRN